MKVFINLSLSFSLCLWMAACSGTSTGNGLGTSTGNGLTSVSMVVQQSDALTGGDPVVIQDALGASYSFNLARVGVRDIDFYLEEGVLCGDLQFDFEAPVVCEDDKVRVQGPFVVDLLTGESTPSLEGLTVPSGNYKRVDVRFDDVKSDWDLVDSDDPILENSFLLEGSIGESGAAYRVSIDVNIEARYRNDESQALPENAPAQVFLQLDPRSWFEALPISQCIEDGEFETLNDLILIQDSGSNCQEIENALKSAIRDSGTLLIQP